MNLSTMQQKALAQCPPALRALVEAEVAAGNSIVEIGHSFPAPPAGAYFKLANKVTTRPRASVDGLIFYERNSSIYSGEFTDAKRFYFIIEPPNPPPPEPDMDAIRKAHEPKPDSLTQLAQRTAGASVGFVLDDSKPCSSLTKLEGQAEQQCRRGSIDEEISKPRRCLNSTESATDFQRVLHFEDRRPPHEVQFALESELMTLFSAKMEGDKLCMIANANVNGARYRFELRFEAALFFRNCYTLVVEASWADLPENRHDYFRKTSDSWFSLWTRNLTATNPPKEDAGSKERYRKLAEAAMDAQGKLDSVAVIQQTIVAEMKRGATYGTSHKEGGTNIFWQNGNFIRSDYGDYPDQKVFSNETEFLAMLRQFCHWDVLRASCKEQRTDLEVWKLILRRLRSK
jgi:hypothetical protein